MQEILKEVDDIEGFAEDCVFRRAQKSILEGQSRMSNGVRLECYAKISVWAIWASSVGE